MSLEVFYLNRKQDLYNKKEYYSFKEECSLKKNPSMQCKYKNVQKLISSFPQMTYRLFSSAIWTNRLLAESAFKLKLSWNLSQPQSFWTFRITGEKLVWYQAFPRWLQGLAARNVIGLIPFTLIAAGENEARVSSGTLQTSNWENIAGLPSLFSDNYNGII